MKRCPSNAFRALTNFKPILAAAIVFCLVSALPANCGSVERPELRTVVIDPGHGGKDPGCVSRDGKTYEKNIVLNVALKLGDKIKDAYPDVKVIYTRSSDKYITLNDRAEIANRNNADLFISIHVDAAPSTSAHGFSTHILGQSSRKDRDLFSMNNDICRRENSVILLEDDYSTTYQGFDPNDPESFIFFNLMQNAHYEQSLLFAAKCDASMAKGPIAHSRGIAQNPFLVLWKTKMPSVLLELGFMSNTADLKVLRSSTSIENIAQRIFLAFRDFKTDYDGSLDYEISDPGSAPEEKAPESSDSGKPQLSESSDSQYNGYGVQIFALGKLLPSGDHSFKGNDAVAVKSGKLYKYIVRASSKDDARAKAEKLKKDFSGSFPVHVEGEKVSRVR